MTNPEEVKEEKKSLNFIEAKVEEDLSNGKNGGRVQTRFPPEPNGYLHIGHAKAICLDFGIAAQHGGVCNLRFDDTNPTKENMEYVDAIKEDIQWLGYQWGNEYYASDYFQQLWDFAIELIKRGKAYIDEQSSEEIAAQKGTPTQPGIESPYRNRPVEESLDLFNKMNNGEIGLSIVSWLTFPLACVFFTCSSISIIPLKYLSAMFICFIWVSVSLSFTSFSIFCVSASFCRLFSRR